ncbi:plasmid mobilization protein [Thiovibrio sp. JS02]
MAFKKPGRPALPDSQRRKNRVRVHFSDLEMQYLTRMAGEGGLVEGGIPDYIRQQALGRKIHSIPTINHEAWVSLARTAANLNQIAHHLHLVEAGVEGGVTPDILEIREALGRLRGQLLGEGFFPPLEDTESHIASANALDGDGGEI